MLFRSLTVQRMSGEEVKAYMYLLCSAWLETPRATLPIDDRELAAMARVSPDVWESIKHGVMRAFVIQGERLVSERLLATSELQEKNRLNGLKPKHKPNHKPNHKRN